MKTVRESTQELLKTLLVDKAEMAAERAESLAVQLGRMMGLDGPSGDEVGAPKVVVLTTSQWVTVPYYRPAGTKIVWVQLDQVRDEGLDAVEVI